MNQSGSEDHTGEFLRGVNYGRRSVGCEFLTGSETPAHTHSPDPGVQAGLHVHIGVAHIDGLGLGDGRNLGEDLIHYGRIGLDGLAFALAQDPHEVIFTEKVVDQLFRAVLVLVGGHGEAHPCGGDGLQHSGNAVIWSCEVAFVGIVVRNEYGGHPLDNFFRGLSGGDGDAEEVVDAAAYHLVVGLDGMGRKAALLQSIIGGVAQILDGVQEGAVKVENS